MLPSLLFDIIQNMKKVKFEWDAKKDKQNQEKHGVSFEFAHYAFSDPDRIIAEDLNHS